MKLYAKEVFSGMVAEDGIDIELPDADYLAIHALFYRVSTGTDTLTVTVKESHDGLNWNTYSTPINGVSVGSRAINSHAGAVDASTAGPALRLNVIVGSNCMAHVRLFVTGRVKKRNPMVRAARAALAARSDRAKGRPSAGGSAMTCR